jgi:hypothetical protein
MTEIIDTSKKAPQKKAPQKKPKVVEEEKK